ncbi:MAG TPA: hypothetical protein VJA25_00500, partial [Dehalococcoidia bacterium]|nr:hypothetical protein [Dehalococcoidia bacterium]
IAINERKRVQAYHLAEAGAEMAIAQLKANGNYAGTGVAEVTLPPAPAAPVGTYKVTVTCVPPAAPAPPCPPATPDQRLISAMGCVRNCTPPSAMSRVEMRVQRGSPFQFAFYGLGVTLLEDGVVVDSYDSAVADYPSGAGSEAHIGSNGNITLWAGSTVKGNAQAGGNVTLGAGSTITGSTTAPAPPVTFPPVDTTPPSPPAPNLNVADGTTVALPAGIHYFNAIDVGANATLNITGPVVIYMTGTFHAQGGAKINATAASTRKPTDLLIFSSAVGEDAVKGYEGGGQFRGAIHAPDAEVEFSAGWTIHGSLIGTQIDIEDAVQFHYDRALARPSTAGGRFRPLAGSWQERL